MHLKAQKGLDVVEAKVWKVSFDNGYIMCIFTDGGQFVSLSLSKISTN